MKKSLFIIFFNKVISYYYGKLVIKVRFCYVFYARRVHREHFKHAGIIITSVINQKGHNNLSSILLIKGKLKQFYEYVFLLFEFGYYSNFKSLGRTIVDRHHS